eukprot:CAMPEP_0179465098 /NCGR_PEP_ID=MMETSP0799-20121207/46755_1 /TAXON_ID=46947 /ORGANISM="Geminigera cryophila, Strain CCMP2564" /LENGTH=156 /DNA_ID=CAMNT_0021269223 /DNA_START=31 /DNA_END=497 /DNA_ORIENTATION=+
MPPHQVEQEKRELATSSTLTARRVAVLVGCAAVGLHVLQDGTMPAYVRAQVRWYSGAPPAGDLYSILGATPKTSDVELKKSYRKLALRWHPDKATPSQRDVHARAFEGISRAYAILTNSLERRIYDNLGDDGVQRWRDGDQTVHPDHMEGVFEKDR